MQIHKQSGDSLVSTPWASSGREKLWPTCRLVGCWMHHGWDVDEVSDHARKLGADATVLHWSALWRDFSSDMARSRKVTLNDYSLMWTVSFTLFLFIPTALTCTPSLNFLEARKDALKSAWSTMSEMHMLVISSINFYCLIPLKESTLTRPLIMISSGLTQCHVSEAIFFR